MCVAEANILRRQCNTHYEYPPIYTSLPWHAGYFDFAAYENYYVRKPILEVWFYITSQIKTSQFNV